GVEALKLARQAPPDLVISALTMPVMDGFTLLRYWGAEPLFRDVPFLTYSTPAAESDRQTAFDMGAAFLTRPDDPDEILEQVRELLTRSNRPSSPSAPLTTDNDESRRAQVRRLEE